MGWIPFEPKEDDELYRRHRLRRLCGGFCVAFCAALVFFVVVLGVATLIVYLVLRPHATHYNITSTSVNTLDVTGASDSLTTTSSVDADFTYELQAVNPNGRVGIQYGKVNVQTTYYGRDIGHSSLDYRFYVGHRTSNTVSLRMFASGVVVNNIVGNALRAEINRQSVSVVVRIDSRVRARIGSYTSFWMWLHSVCDVVVTPPSAGVAGTLVGSRCRNV